MPLGGDGGDALADGAGEVGLDHRLAGAGIDEAAGDRRLEPGVERDHGQAIRGRADAADDQPAEIDADEIDQPVVLLRLLQRDGEAGEDRQRVGDGDAVVEQRAEDARDRGKVQRRGVDRLDQPGGAGFHAIEQRLDLVRAEQRGGAVAEHLVEVRGDHRRRIDREEALGRGEIALRRIDP